MSRKIEDHAFWAGAKSKGSVFPEGAKVKNEAATNGAGAETNYPDTAEAIHKDQGMGVSKIKGRPLKDGYRN